MMLKGVGGVYELVVGKQPTVGAGYALERNTQGSREQVRHPRRARCIAATADLSASLAMVIEQTRADNEF